MSRTHRVYAAAMPTVPRGRQPASRGAQAGLGVQPGVFTSHFGVARDYHRVAYPQYTADRQQSAIHNLQLARFLTLQSAKIGGRIRHTVHKVVSSVPSTGRPLGWKESGRGRSGRPGHVNSRNHIFCNHNGIRTVLECCGCTRPNGGVLLDRRE